MIHLNISKKLKSFFITVSVIGLISIGIGVLPAYSHGGKTHGEEMFSAFQAVQMATQLYERLITSGKLPETWETELTSIHINIRQSKDKREYVVQFKKTKGEPDSVYFFFNQEGEYAGSNFSGK